MNLILSCIKRILMVNAMAMVFAVMLMAPPVLAAPQILGVVASNQLIPMNCSDGTCVAELTTICLQRNRDDPESGTVYEFDRTGSATLVVTAANGIVRKVPAGDHIRITSRRLYTAAQVTLTKDALQKLGGVKAALFIDKAVSLVPVAVAGDPDPISAQERQYVTESMRTVADRWVGSHQDKAVAAVIVNRLINRTPRQGRMDKQARLSIWDRTLTKGDDGFSKAGREKASEMLDACQFRVKVGRYFSLRSCLEVKNDSLISDINTRYWKGIEAGS